ncbi:MAG TPA: methyltransferase, partial [Intrasporangium sp.]|nr:methyltransferase [Intrasporangium sp.]
MAPQVPSSPPPPAVEAGFIARLRVDLLAARFTVDGVAERLGPLAFAALHREQPVPALLATAPAPHSTDPAVPTPDSCGTLIRLFTLGQPVSRAALDTALPTLRSDGARSLRLVRGDGDQVVATCDLRPYSDDTHDWWVASDLSELVTRQPLRPDHVLGIGGATTTLASWTIRRRVGRALDLGTGAGVQALHLGSHAESIVATDISERALAFGRFNAALARLEVDFRIGDLLDPVAGERFSLVVSNPPFVITPRDEDVPVYEYRDGGRPGDAVVRSLVQQLEAVLEPGGVAQLLGNWEVPAGRSWRDVWDEWLEGVGLDAWVVQREVQDPAEYAELWSRDGGHLPGSAEHDRLCAAWLHDFTSRGVESIGFGVVALQRPADDR